MVVVASSAEVWCDSGAQKGGRGNSSASELGGVSGKRKGAPRRTLRGEANGVDAVVGESKMAPKMTTEGGSAVGAKLLLETR